MITAVDTNVLLDLLIPGQPEAARAGEQALEAALAAGALIIGEAVYAELAVHFIDQAPLDTFLVVTGITLEPTPREALALAATAFRSCLSRRGQGFYCPACGSANNLVCSACGRPIQARQHVISDFLIGAHAQACAGALLSRDRGIYHTYFPTLRLVSP